MGNEVNVSAKCRHGLMPRHFHNGHHWQFARYAKAACGLVPQVMKVQVFNIRALG
jgi:hypothetical protein